MSYKLKNAEDVLNEDQKFIVQNLEEELFKIAGKKILITGGAGFLGYYLIHTILYWNNHTDNSCHIRVTVLDNFIRGFPRWLHGLEKNQNLTLLKHNIVEPLPNNIDDFQYIIHAAGIASPIYYRAHPIETMDANIYGLRNLLDYCLVQQGKDKPVEGFLFYSSSEIYGDPDSAFIPTPETYRGFVSCTGPRACYDESKRYGETLCVNFSQQYNLPIKVARPFNNYGPGLKITDRRVIPDFARDIFAGNNIVMLSDGSPTRTFCYIADAIVGYYKILVNGRSGEAYNIGVAAPEISIADLVDRLVAIAKELLGYSGKVVRETSISPDYLVDNPNRRCPVIEKARAELGYQPSITLDEGLRRSLIWYSDNRTAEDA
jgi:nucleoside-diphosphate-sugar epimerase